MCASNTSGLLFFCTLLNCLCSQYYARVEEQQKQVGLASFRQREEKNEAGSEARRIVDVDAVLCVLKSIMSSLRTRQAEVNFCSSHDLLKSVL